MPCMATLFDREMNSILETLFTLHADYLKNDFQLYKGTNLYKHVILMANDHARIQQFHVLKYCVQKIESEQVCFLCASTPKILTL